MGVDTPVCRRAPTVRTAARLRALRPLRAARQSCVGLRLARLDAGAAAARKRRALLGKAVQLVRAAGARAARAAPAAR